MCRSSNISDHFMEPKGSILCSQQTSSGPYPEPDKSSPYHHILSPSLKSILIVFTNLCFVLLIVSVLLAFHQYPIHITLLPHSRYIACPSHPHCPDYSNYTWQRVQVSLSRFLQPPAISSPLGPNILLSSLFSNTLSLRSSINVRDHIQTHIQNHRQNSSLVYSNLYVFRQQTRRQ
jgi:hypothetical protein